MPHGTGAQAPGAAQRKAGTMPSKLVTIKVTAKQRETLAAALADTEVSFNEQGDEATFAVADPADFLAARFGDKNKAFVTAITKKIAAAAPAKPAAKKTAAKAGEEAKPAARKVNKPYINKQRKRRNTGTTTRILYLLADNRPADAMPPAKADDGTELAFAVECVDHGGHRHHATYAAAYTAAKNSAEWCPPCAEAAKGVEAARAAQAEADKHEGQTVTVKGDGTAKVTNRKKAQPAAKAEDKAKEKASA